MCHAEARAQDARRRACRHRLKMVGPSKASPTQRHNDRGADRATARYYPTLAGSPSRSPDRGPGGGVPVFCGTPGVPIDTHTRHATRRFMGRDGGRAPPACAQHQHRQGFTSVCWRRLSPPTPPDSSRPSRRRHSRTPWRPGRRAAGHRARRQRRTSRPSHRAALPGLCWPPVKKARRFARQLSARHF